MGLSCFGSMALKSRFVKVIPSILLCRRVEVKFTVCTFLKCLFLKEAEEPPATNPLAIVLITPWIRIPRRLSLSLRRLGDLEPLLLEDRCAPLSLGSF